MGFNIRDILKKQSIIQLTLLKVILSILVFLILFILLYGQNFWEKQTLKFNYDLLLSALNVQTRIQSQILTVEEFKKDKNLTKNDKALKIEGIIQFIINNNKNNDYIIGYYDNDLDLIVKNQYNNISFDQIRSAVLSYDEFNNISNSNNVRLILPIYDEGKIVGSVWAHAQNADLVLMSFNELSAIVILALSLSALIIISIRKHMKQIESYLEKFCNIIINNDSKHENILIKLPELKPVLNKITGYTNDLKQMNITLESSKLNIIKIMEGISDGFYALDRNWKFTFVNKETKKFINGNNTELIGKSIWEVFPQIKDSLTYRKMQEAMSQNESVHWEAGGFAHPDQNHEYHAYPYKEGVTVFFRDVTELKRQQQELGRLERLNLIGQLAAGISHEIRNPLTTVKGFLQLMGSKSKYAQEKEYMDLMISEIDRANSIITDFLSLAKSNSENILSGNINDVINKVFPMLQADAFNSNKEVATDLELLPDIMINENEIKQLILNLVRNGLEVTNEHGSVIICTYFKGDRVVLAIRDQGNGIPIEIQEKIGTPFFTTKETGTGLGLAISMGIAQRHNAVFEFETGKNGTTFYTLFPTCKLIID
ncbi:nitrogen regulation protein NR(II) [Desulfosporosinus sp. BICA1-9]|uniref:two-component system sensor histidine kinase NtrB n=1 Tax=Desulfosporosinus sp. BICA1-9 TaxID=1531958 RepID=UPI00054C33E0|nr:ATP-binding protein [Desulfosporosinus sp. BICA1-9]KJS46419.1 MAG: histidine kinase [Peptococcaceae bacterium BRH_c23]KJS84066.1 MAG: histidine kinase [Desulfosporosinus sp. BICA1-9]